MCLCKTIFVSASYSFSVKQVGDVCTQQVVLYMCLYVCKSIGPFVSYMCLSRYLISNRSTSKKHVFVSSLFDVLLHKIHSKVLLVLSYQRSTSLDP